MFFANMFIEMFAGVKFFAAENAFKYISVRVLFACRDMFIQVPLLAVCLFTLGANKSQFWAMQFLVCVQVSFAGECFVTSFTFHPLSQMDLGLMCLHCRPTHEGLVTPWLLASEFAPPLMNLPDMSPEQ